MIRKSLGMMIRKSFVERRPLRAPPFALLGRAPSDGIKSDCRWRSLTSRTKRPVPQPIIEKYGGSVQSSLDRTTPSSLDQFQAASRLGGRAAATTRDPPGYRSSVVFINTLAVPFDSDPRHPFFAWSQALATSSHTKRHVCGVGEFPSLASRTQQLPAVGRLRHSSARIRA